MTRTPEHSVDTGAVEDLAAALDANEALVPATGSPQTATGGCSVSIARSR
jgi:hypothetical protein